MFENKLDRLANEIDVYLRNQDKIFLDKLFDQSSNEDYFLILSRFNISSPVFLNNQALNLLEFKSYIDVKKNWFFVENIIDIDSTNILVKALKHFLKYPNKDFDMCYQVKTLNGEKKWVYGISRVLSFTSENLPDYILTIGVEIKKLMQKQADQNQKSLIYNALKNNINIELKLDLTERELQILDLIALGLETKEIAERLYISSHTVKTHRKNLMKKLKVNSGADLMRYAIFSQLLTN